MSNPFESISTRLDNQEAILLQILKVVNNENESIKDYSKAQFAKLIDKSQSWVDNERRAGRLNFFKRGGTVRIPATELKKYQA